MLQQFNTTVQDSYVLIPNPIAKFSLLSIPKLLAFFAFTVFCLFSTISPLQAQSGSGSVIDDLGGRMAPQIQPTTVWGQFIMEAQSPDDPAIQLQILDNNQKLVFQSHLQKQRLSAPELPSGKYIIRVRLRSGKWLSRQFVVI